jgi:hypothetical protein
MGAANGYVADVIARIDDFVGLGVQWQRRLWDVGLPFAFRETLEISDGVQRGALSTGALKRHAESLHRGLTTDPAAGDEMQRKRLQSLLTRDLTAGGANHNELRHWTEDVERHYLSRWRGAVTSESKPSREQVARALACELFRHGLSPERLRDWTKTIRNCEELISEGDLVDHAQDLIRAGLLTYSVMVAFAQPPHRRIPRPPEWREATTVSEWLVTNGFSRVRQHGGFLLTLDARDPHAAAALALDTTDRLVARAAVGTRDKLSFVDRMFVAGYATPVVVARSRRAEVHTLERENHLLNLSANDEVDQALELLSHLNTAAAPVAAAAGWAAVESLLSGPGDNDKVVTAERLANLVACSWPRAELTTIGWARIYQTGRKSDELASELRGYETNRERSDRVLQAIDDGDDLQLARPAEQLALRRMEKLRHDPRRELIAVRERAADSLRRLYRQRNLVVHGGQTAGFGLASALRTASPLVGAGIDRIAHAALVTGLRPLEIAARAQMEIERAGTRNAPLLTGMLD